jgi:hypothetical protein
MTLGRVVAPRSIPDDAPGLEHTDSTVMFWFFVVSVLIKPHIRAPGLHKLARSHITKGKLIVEQLHTV